MARLDVEPAAAQQNMEEVITALFLSGLEFPGDLAAMEGVAARPLSGWTGRVLTVGVDSGAAATVVPASQFPEYPSVPNAMSSSGKV